MVEANQIDQLEKELIQTETRYLKLFDELYKRYRNLSPAAAEKLVRIDTRLNERLKAVIAMDYNKCHTLSDKILACKTSADQLKIIETRRKSAAVMLQKEIQAYNKAIAEMNKHK